MIRKARINDLSGILQVYDCARGIMKENGNPHQWGDHYPEKEILLQDIRDRNAYVWEENNHIGGVFVLIFGDDPTYAKIDGAWLNDRPYGTLHRVAGDRTVKGLMEKCLSYCFRQTDNLRVDTHADNRIMQHILQKNGFQYCGRIWVMDGSERLAYQKCLPEGKWTENDPERIEE